MPLTKRAPDRPIRRNPARSPISRAGPAPVWPSQDPPRTIGRQTRSVADAAIDDVFLMIEQALLAAGDMATVEPRHGPLFVPDHAVLPMQPAGLPGSQFALAPLLMKAEGLVGEPRVHPSAARA